MQTAEYYLLDKIDAEHWFYRGKRDIVRHWLSALGPSRKDGWLVDIGVGTGQFLLEMREQFPRQAGCFPSLTALHLAARHVSGLVCAGVERIPLRSELASVLTALDVLEHVEDDRGGMKELVRITQPGGLIFVNVPAFPALWSDWDVSLGHKRRYVKRTLLQLVDTADVDIVHCAYTNVFVFPLIFVYRRATSRWKLLRGARLEDRLPGALTNRLLHALYVWPARLRWFRAPFGTSLFLVLQKHRAGLSTQDDTSACSVR